MKPHLAFAGTKFCQVCLVWLPAIDVIPEWRDCMRDRFRFRETAQEVLASDETLTPRIRATDTDAKPQPDDYVRWNAKFVEPQKLAAVEG